MGARVLSPWNLLLQGSFTMRYGGEDARVSHCRNEVREHNIQ